MLSFLTCALWVAVTAPSAPEVHRMTIAVRGPLALVEVERTLLAEGGAARELVWDVALPQEAAVTGWQVTGEGRAVRLAAADPTRARADHAATLTARAVAATRATVDDGTDFRLHLAGLPAGGRALLRYRYAAPLACHRGRFVLR